MQRPDALQASPFPRKGLMLQVQSLNFFLSKASGTQYLAGLVSLEDFVLRPFPKLISCLEVMMHLSFKMLGEKRLGNNLSSLPP